VAATDNNLIVTQASGVANAIPTHPSSPIPPPRPAPIQTSSSSSTSVMNQQAIRSSSTVNVCSSTTYSDKYNDKVVAFLRQVNIMEILKERKSSVSSNTSLRDKVNAIRGEGT